MSANTTLGRPAIASSSRRASAVRSQPAFETGTSPCSSPAMAWTAWTSAWATASWASTIPARRSLIVLLEILAGDALGRVVVGAAAVLLLLHPRDQALVELRRRVRAAAVLEQVPHRHHFGDHRDVLARIERHQHLGQRHVEDPGLLAFQPGAVVGLGAVPVVELHHHLDALLLAHRPDAEERGDVDQPHAA